MVMKSEVLIERLLALVLRPGRHRVAYHGVLAPAARVPPQPFGFTSSGPP